MRVVIDINVLVSGVISRAGPPARIVEQVAYDLGQAEQKPRPKVKAFSPRKVA